MRRTFSLSVALAVLLLVVPLRIVSGAPNSDTSTQSTRLVRLGLRDGSSKVVRLDGVGCAESICSRVAVNSHAVGNVIVNRTQLDTIAAIRDITNDSALFVFGDGSRRRVSVIPDN